MKKLRLFLAISIVSSLLLSSISVNATAGPLRSVKPGTRLFYYYCHSSIPSGWRDAVNWAHIEWNYAPGNIQFYKYDTIVDNAVVIGDSQSTASMITFTYWGLPANAVGACNTGPYDNYTSFDVFCNSGYSSLFIWSQTRSNDYIDIQGVFEHEFGHVIGLADYTNYPTPNPTMSDPTTSYGQYYDFKSLEIPDKDGKQAVSNLLP